MLAAAQKLRQFGAFGLAEFDPIAYIHPCLLVLRHARTAESDGRSESPCKNLHTQAGPISGVYPPLHAPAPPAAGRTEMQDYFRVSPPSVHQMVLTLEQAGFIRRQPRTPAASNCSLIRHSCQSYFDPGFNRSRSLCRGTRAESVQVVLRAWSSPGSYPQASK